MLAATIDEVFASIQGEGSWVGQRQLFVRFTGCDLSCRYCDTRAAAMALSDGRELSCRAQISPESFDRESIPNPIDQRTLLSLCERLVIPGRTKPVVSLTGGEPLLQAAFLGEWLPRLRGTFRIHLETAGVHHAAMRDLRGQIDMVSMDLKLPSATGQGPRWEEHRRFLRSVAGIETVLKIIVTSDTSDADLLDAVRLAAEERRDAPFIIQPCTGDCSPSGEALIAMQRHALAFLPDVRVIPQAHHVLGLP